MEVIPALDVLDGKTVRLLQGDYEKVTVYTPSPIEVGVDWVKNGASMVHVVDLDAARGAGRTLAATVRELHANGVRCQVGGGIRTPEDAVSIMEAGAERVVVGSAFVDVDGHGEAIARAVGAEAVVAAIDVRGGLATGHGWRTDGPPFAQVAARALDAGVSRMLVTGIAVDGTMDGPDHGLLRTIADLDESVRLIASGGVGSLDDLAALARGPAEAAIVGRALHENRFTLAEAIQAAKRPGK